MYTLLYLIHNTLSQAEIIRLSSRQSLLLPGHSSYVQGVTWDPLNQYVVTQSSDRTCKVHQASNIR